MCWKTTVAPREWVQVVRSNSNSGIRWGYENKFLTANTGNGVVVPQENNLICGVRVRVKIEG